MHFQRYNLGFILLILLSLYATPATLLAQEPSIWNFWNLLGQRQNTNIYMRTPMKFEGHVIDENDTRVKDNVSSSTWKVYGAAEGMRTYLEPDRNSKLSNKYISFMQEFCVESDSNGFLHIYSDPGCFDGRKTSNSIDYYWVSTRDMLLWRKCLITKNRVNRKVLILTSIESVDQPIKEIVGPGGKDLLDAPNDMGQSLNAKAELLSLYYLLKTSSDSNYFLLMRNDELGLSSSSVTNLEICGWIKKDLCTQWDHRLALEANWDQKAVEERLTVRNRPVRLFTDSTSAVNYLKGKDVDSDHILSKADPAFYYNQKALPDGRFIGDTLRYPFTRRVRSGSNEYIETAYLALSDRDSQTNRVLENLIDQTKDCEIVFVIDRSLIVDTYNVLSSIKDIVNGVKERQISGKDGNYRTNFHFGAVFYRNDQNSNMASDLYSCSDHKSISDFELYLQNKGNDVAIGLNPNAPNAIYKGIERALNSFGTSAYKSLIIIGGSIDPASPNFVRSLAQKAAEKNCDIFAYQAYRPNSDTIFQSSIMSFVEQSAREAGLQHSRSYIYSWNSRNFDMTTRKFYTTSGEIASILAPASISSIQHKMLCDSINTVINGIDEFLGAMEFKIRTGDTVGLNLSPQVNEYFLPEHIRRRLNIEPSALENLINQPVFRLSIKCFTIDKQSQDRYNWYKPVLLVSAPENSQLYTIFKNMADPITNKTLTPDDKRDALHGALIATAAIYLGGSRPGGFENMTLNELISAILGVPSEERHTVLGDVKIGSILLSDFPISKVETIITKLSDVTKILENNIQRPEAQPRRFVRDIDKKYFWLDDEMFP